MVPETNALSVLSYGRIVDSKELMEFKNCSNGPTLPDIVPGISSRRFPALFGDNVTDNTHSNSSAELSERILDRLSSPRKPKTDCNMVTQWFLVSLMPLSNVVERRGPLSKEQATPTAPRVRVLSGHPKDSLSSLNRAHQKSTSPHFRRSQTQLGANGHCL